MVATSTSAATIGPLTMSTRHCSAAGDVHADSDQPESETMGGEEGVGEGGAEVHANTEERFRDRQRARNRNVLGNLATLKRWRGDADAVVVERWEETFTLVCRPVPHDQESVCACVCAR